MFSSRALQSLSRCWMSERRARGLTPWRRTGKRTAMYASGALPTTRRLSDRIFCTCRSCTKAPYQRVTGNWLRSSDLHRLQPPAKAACRVPHNLHVPAPDIASPRHTERSSVGCASGSPLRARTESTALTGRVRNRHSVFREIMPHSKGSVLPWRLYCE